MRTQPIDIPARIPEPTHLYDRIRSLRRVDGVDDLAGRASQQGNGTIRNLPELPHNSLPAKGGNIESEDEMTAIEAQADNNGHSADNGQSPVVEEWVRQAIDEDGARRAREQGVTSFKS